MPYQPPWSAAHNKVGIRARLGLGQRRNRDAGDLVGLPFLRTRGCIYVVSVRARLETGTTGRCSRDVCSQPQPTLSRIILKATAGHDLETITFSGARVETRKYQGHGGKAAAVYVI